MNNTHRQDDQAMAKIRDHCDSWLAKSLPEMVELRRDLHAHPERSGQEHRTTGLIVNRLTEAGLSPVIKDEHSGLFVDLELAQPDAPVFAIRADMDCVDVPDEKNVPWRSQHEGCCHACGHDAHTTMVAFSALSMLTQIEAIRECGPRQNVRFIFQPAEETSTGAQDMIERGALDRVNQIVALHCEPYLETGRIGMRVGPLTANLQSFRITLQGRGGHSARPHEAVDPVPAAVNLISLLYQLGPRSVDSRRAHCVTVTSIRTGDAINAIPDSTEVCGTIRAARTDVAETLRSTVVQCVEAACKATGCRPQIEFPHQAPATHNDREVIELMTNAACDVVGREGVINLELPSLGGEDFAFYQQKVPGAMIRLGTGTGLKDDRPALHSGLFDIDESSLLVGSRLLTSAALRAIL
ncbi:MAG: amidohydrolase [Phycisphaerales bacterium]|nr:amidohydrolase [Phycisphaerales bacterium]